MTYYYKQYYKHDIPAQLQACTPPTLPVTVSPSVPSFSDSEVSVSVAWDRSFAVSSEGVGSVRRRGDS